MKKLTTSIIKMGIGICLFVLISACPEQSTKEKPTQQAPSQKPSGQETISPQKTTENNHNPITEDDSEEDDNNEEEIPLPSLPEMSEKEKFEFISEFFQKKPKDKSFTPTRFDDYLKGDSNILNKQEKQGLFKFVVYGCAGCHEGIGVGGNRKEKLGIMATYKQNGPTKRYEVTKNTEDQYVLVSSLRNVIQTPPYFHDNGVTNISDAVQLMAKLQLGFNLAPQDVADIVVFLNTLTHEKK